MKKVRQRETGKEAVLHHANPNKKSDAVWVKVLGTGKWESWQIGTFDVLLSEEWAKRRERERRKAGK